MLQWQPPASLNSQLQHMDNLTSWAAAGERYSSTQGESASSIMAMLAGLLRGSASTAPGGYWSTALTRSLQGLQKELTQGVMSDGQWLLSGEVAMQQLTALGYQPQALLQLLQDAAAALILLNAQLLAARDGVAAAPVLRAVQQQLQAVGGALTSFAVPYTCNNPGCANVSGPSEAALAQQQLLWVPRCPLLHKGVPGGALGAA